MSHIRLFLAGLWVDDGHDAEQSSHLLRSYACAHSDIADLPKSVSCPHQHCLSYPRTLVCSAAGRPVSISFLRTVPLLSCKHPDHRLYRSAISFEYALCDSMTRRSLLYLVVPMQKNRPNACIANARWLWDEIRWCSHINMNLMKHKGRSGTGRRQNVTLETLTLLCAFLYESDA